MKKLIINGGFLAAFAVALFSCEDEPAVHLNANAVIEPSASEDDVVLTEEMEGEDALTISWPSPEYGFSASPAYTILLSNNADFTGARSINIGTSTSKTFKAEELNAILLNLDYEAEESGTLNIRVDGKLGTYQTLVSESFTITVTPYSSFLDLSTPWGVVGGAYNNWGNGPDAPFFTTGTSGVLVSYVTVRDGMIKFRQNSDWGNNVGDNGADGTLEANGSDIAVTAGTKKITFNTNNMTYTIENYSWGVVGSAWNNWGNPDGTPDQTVTPDLQFYYDDSSDTWKAIGVLKTGAFKIRKNNDWGVNYGDDGGNGSLESGGADIQVTAGKYLLIFDEKNMTLAIEPFEHDWGIVGSAYNNWGQDVAPANGIQDMLDGKLIRDWKTEDTWVLKNVILLAGELKIRDGNSWGLNYGDTGANGTLEENGDNIAVVAGLHTITVDFAASPPTITVVKHND